MENVQRQKSCQNSNTDILFKNCNVKKVSQKSQIKEKFDTKQNIQRLADLTRTPNTLQNSGIFIKYDDTQQTSFHSSFQNLSNPKHFNYQNQFKNDSKNQQNKNINNFDFDENNQRLLNPKIENSDSIKFHKINDYQNSKKQQHSPLKKNQNAQNMENLEKQQNNFENKFQLFNQATYLNKINIKQSSKDLCNQTQESSYIEYAKKIIKQSDEQLQLLQRLTPRKRQSQEKQKKSQNQFQIQTEHNMFQKVIQEDLLNQKGGSKLKLIDCSPQKQEENQYFSKIKKNNKPSQKQILNQEQFIIDQIRLEHSKYQKRTKNRPKSSGFSHQQSQFIRKKSNKQLLDQTKNHSKLDITQKSQESLINSTLTKQQNHISVNITNDKINQMDSCISIKQYGNPGKIIKSQTKFNNTNELVSKSLIFKKKKESKFENKSKEDTTQKSRLKQTQSTHRIQQNVSQRCKSTLNHNDSFVQQKVKNMQEEYLKSKLLDSSKDISFRKSHIVQNNNKVDKLMLIGKEVQSQAQSSFIRQKSSEQDKYLQSSINLKQQNNEILSKLRQNLFQENKNHYQSESIKDSQPIQIELHQNENGKLIQKNYLRASKNQISKKQSQNKIDPQKNVSILEETLLSNQDQINYEKLLKIQIQSAKEKELLFQKQEQNEQFQKQKQEAFEQKKSKKQTFSHIKIITKPPENVQQEMNKVTQKQTQISEFSYKNQSIPPQIIKAQNISPQNQTKKKLHLIFQKFGAILKGYKTRRIYNHSKLVKQDRFEFRDLIQFAYSLKQELAQFQNKMKESSPVKDRSQSVHIKQKLEGQIEQTKKLLLQSLKDLIQKRQQFSIHFNRLLEGNTEWIHESKNVKFKNCSTPDTKYSQMNFLRKSSSLEPFISNSQNTKKKINAQSPIKQKITLKSPSQKNTENSSFKESKLQSDKKEQQRKTDNKQTQGQNIKNQNNEDQSKSLQYIKQNWNEQKDNQDQNNKLKNYNLKQEGDKLNNHQNEYQYKNQSINFADHLSKKLQQKKRQISQLTFGESADAMVVNQSRTESIMDMRKFQKDNSNNNGLTFNKKINDDNFNSVKDSPSKKFQSIQKGFNSIRDSPNKISQIYKVQDNKINLQNSTYLRQSTQIEAIGSKKYRESSKISEPCIVHSNYESAQLFNIGKERDQLIEEQQQLDTESQFQQKQLNGQKKSFLRKGEKSRKQFDPLRSIQTQKLQKQQSKEKMASVDNQNDLQTLPYNETKERSNSLNINSQKCIKNQRTLTPQSHKKSLNRFIQGYQSPYQQVNSLISLTKQDELKVENNQEIIQLKNKNLPNQSPSHMNDQRWINKINNTNFSFLRNEKKSQNYKILQDQKDMNLSNSEIISISINQQEEKRKSINFISKIPRLSSVQASVCKSEIEQKNKSPNKSPVKQAIKNEDIIKNINLMKKNSIDSNNKSMENQRFNIRKNNRLTNESKSDINLRQSDQNQTYTSHHSSIIEKSSNRKNSIIEKSSNQQAQKKEHLQEINQIIKQQNLQYIKNLSSVKQQTKPSTKMSNCSNQELSQELNKLRQSLVFKNLGIQKQNMALKLDQGHMASIDNNHSKIFESQNQERFLQKQSFSQQKLSMSASKKILQMSKSKPSNRYHEKSESDTFSQINICENFKKESLANLNIIEKQKEFKIQNFHQQNEIQQPEIIKEYNQQINYIGEQIVEVIKTQREEIDIINRFNENSPSINDISAAGSNLASPQSKITYRYITNLENLTPIKNMNFENQYVANLKKLKKEGANSPKRPNFIKQAPQTNFEFNLIGMIAEQQDLNVNSYQKIVEVDEDQFSNKEVHQNNIDEIELKPEGEVTISIFDNKQTLFNMGLSSNFESQNSSFQKQSIEFQSQILKNDDQNYNNQKQQLQQQVKRNGSQFSRFLNHNQDMNQSINHNESSTDKDTSTFRIQPLKINSIANTSSIMSSVRGEMIITNNIQNNYNPIQSCNHTKYNSIYDVISTSIMNPCCSETIHKYGQSPGAKSSSPIHKMGSVNKNQDYSSQADIYSPAKKSPSKILNKQSDSKENIKNENNENIYQRLNEDTSDQKSQSKIENQVFLYPQIIQGKQNKDSVQCITQNENHFKSIQILQSQENKMRGTESRRRSRGERTSQQKQTAPNLNNNYTRNKLNANVINNLSQNKIDLNQTEIIQEIYQHTQNSLEQPDSNVPKALPTPQRHDQFQSQMRTPTKSNFDDRQSTINSNTAKQFSQYDIEASCNKTMNSKRLTQLKRSNQGKKVQNSPFKTPQKSQISQQKQISVAKQLAKTETSYKKSSKLYDNQIQQQNNEIDALKVAETIEQLKFVLGRLKSQEKLQNQYISEEHIAKSRQIEQMIVNLQEQQTMFNQFIQEQSNLNIR